MSASEIARKVMRDVRNRWSYAEVENFVRDATSNTNDPPSPAQIRQIGDSMLYYDSYPKAFNMLWRRLTHLEYKRHVAKALLVLDNLVRIRPPSKAVQLKLMVDIRERWPEIWRLAQLRPSSSSETIAQIQRVAERLCQFIMGYESGYILPDDTEEEDEDGEEARRMRRTRRRRKKKTTTVEEEEVEDEGREGIDDNDDGLEEEDEEEAEADETETEGAGRNLQPPTSLEPMKPAMPPMSPFGFDFFSHTNFEWQPAPSANPLLAQPKQPAALVSPVPASGWSCKACTFVNPLDKDKCEICGGEKHQDMDEKDNHPHQHQHGEKEEKKDDVEQQQDDGWACSACSFMNRPEAEQCEVCETKRGANFIPAETGDGMEGMQKEGSGTERGEGKDGEPDGEVDEKEGSSNSANSSSSSSGSMAGGEGSQLPGTWACSYCSWLNPPTAVICEVCEREGKRSGMAQLVKLEMARKHEQARTESEQAAPRQAWSCNVCTFVNTANRTQCGACGAHSPYAAELALTGGAGSSYTSNAPSPQLSPRSQSRRASQRLSTSMPSAQFSELPSDSLLVPQQPAQSHQRNTGYAAGHSDRSQRRLSGDEAKDDVEADGGGAELLDAVQSQESEMAHQMAALQHYNKQRELYKEQHGWTCPACSFRNDPHSNKCEICDTPTTRPGVPGVQQAAPPASSQPQSSQSQLLPQQRQQAQRSQSPQPQQQYPAAAPGSVQRAPSISSMPVALPVAKPVSQSVGQRPSLPAAQPSSQPQSRPSIPASVPNSSSSFPSSSSAIFQQPSLPSSKPPSASSREQPGNLQRLGSISQQSPHTKPSLVINAPPMHQPLSVSTAATSAAPSLPSSVPNQRAVSSSGPLSPPVVIPSPQHSEDWFCSICTYRNSWGDDTCLMCMAPKAVAPDRAAQLPAFNPPISPQPQQAAAAQSRPNLPSPTTPAIIAPPMPATSPSVGLNARRATQPLPLSRPPGSSPPAAATGRLSVLDGMPGGVERGPAIVPGSEPVHFPAQYQQQQMQQAMYQQEMARQQAMRQQMATQNQQYAQQMAAMSAAQQLASLTPLSQQSPQSQQRQQLHQQEEMRRKQQQEQAMREQQQQRATEQRSKGSLDSLINEHFQISRQEDKPVELPLAPPTPPMSGRTSPAPSLLFPGAGASPPTYARSLSNSSSAPPGAPPSQFHSMFDQAAQGFAVDLVGRRASHDHIQVQTAPPRSTTPTSQIIPASPTPSPVPGAPRSASADWSSDSPKSARSDSASNPKPRRDRSPVKREARASLPLDQLKMPSAALNSPLIINSTSPPAAAIPAIATPALSSPPRTAAAVTQQTTAPLFSMPSSAPVVSHQRLDSWDTKAAAASAQGRQITPFDTPQSTPLAVQDNKSLFDFPMRESAALAPVSEQQGEQVGEAAHPVDLAVPAAGESEQPRRASGAGEADDSEAAWQRRPGYVHEEAQQQAEKQKLSPRKRLMEKAAQLAAPGPAPAVVVPKRPISDEAKGSISALAAALAASAAQQASVKATQSPAAEARQLAAAAALAPQLTVPEMPAPPPAPVQKPAQPIKATPPAVPPHPDKAKTLALQLPRSDSGSINRLASDEPSTPVSTNRSSSTTRSSSTNQAPLSKAEMREKVRAEILSTESFYVDCLNDLIKYYMQPLQRNGPKMHVEPRHVSAIFQNLTVLQQFHSIFLDDLKKNPNTAAVFVQFADFLKMYTQYVAGYEKSIATINSLRQNKAFQKMMEDTRDQLKGRGIMTYLIMPVQRIPRYVLLLRELKKNTPPDHPETESLAVALTKIESIGTHINESKRQVEQMSKLLDIQNRLKNKEFVIFKPDRRLIKEGLIHRLTEEYVLERSREEPHPSDVETLLLFLFNDLLMWTTKEFDIAGHVSLDTLLCLPDATFKVPYTLSLGVRGKAFMPDMIFACKDQAEKDEWSRYIMSAINTATDPTRRKAANSGTLGSGQPNRTTVSRSDSQSVIKADPSDMYDPPSRNSSSVNSSNGSNYQPPPQLPPPSMAPPPLPSAANTAPPPMMTTTTIPPVPMSQFGGSSSISLQPALSSSALLLQVLHPTTASSANSINTQSVSHAPLSVPPPFLSSTMHTGAPPPMLSSYNQKPPSQQPPH